MKKNLLWVGPIVSNEQMLNSSAVSPAGNKWQLNLLTALMQEGTSITNIGFLPQRVFPCGKYKGLGSNTFITRSVVSRQLKYLNIPYIRPISISKNYKSFADQYFNNNKITLVITYNATKENVYFGNYIKSVYGIPWICIIADISGPAPPLNRLNDILVHADGAIYLSWKGFNQSKLKNKFHFEGFVELLSNKINIENTPKIPKILLYSGNMDVYAGLYNFCKGFNKVQAQNVEFWISGKGRINSIKNLISNDARIKFFGLVDNNKLNDLYSKADIFINPRKTELVENEYNFPSKILDYLSYCKPILSTWTEGLHPEYRKYLTLFNDKEIKNITDAIEETLTWNVEKYYSISRNIYNFVVNSKQRSIQIKKLIKWLDKIIEMKHQ